MAAAHRAQTTDEEGGQDEAERIADKRDAILARESTFAREFAARSLERPVLTLWTIVLPVLLVPYFLRRITYRSGAETCINYYLRPRMRALDIATGDAAEEEPASEEGADIADARYSKTLVKHYRKLLSGEGDDYRELVLTAYKTPAAYERQLGRIEAAHRAVDEELLADSEADLGAKQAAKMREAAQRILEIKRAMHREEMDWLFRPTHDSNGKTAG